MLARTDRAAQRFPAVLRPVRSVDEDKVDARKLGCGRSGIPDLDEAVAVEDSNTVAGSLIRNPDGKDTNDAAADWTFTTTITRGAANVLTP